MITSHNENPNIVQDEKERGPISTQIPEEVIKKPNRKLVNDSEIEEEEIQQDNIETVNINRNGIPREFLDKLKEDYTTIDDNLRQRFQLKKPEPSVEDTNMERQYLEEHFNTYQPPNLSPEVLLTNKVVKSTVQALHEINDGLNLGIEKNEELGKSWETHKVHLNKFFLFIHDDKTCIYIILNELFNI